MAPPPLTLVSVAIFTRGPNPRRTERPEDSSGLMDWDRGPRFLWADECDNA